jgi:hypothetical protein
MITGIGQAIQHPTETVDIPSALMLGRWFQVYKAAVNFDVYRTQMYCSIAYCGCRPFFNILFQAMYFIFYSYIFRIFFYLHNLIVSNLRS